MYSHDDSFVLETLARVGAVITNSHVVYTSGKHGSAYVNKDAVYPHTKETSMLCLEIARQFANDNIDVVIAPAIGGVALEQWTAHHLSKLMKREVLGVYAEKVPIILGVHAEGETVGVPVGEGFAIKRGYDKLISGKRVLVVEDILTTGASARKVIEAVREIGGNVVGLGVLCNRGGVTKKVLADVPQLMALVDINLESWDEKDCPLCKVGAPINTDVGKGREFLARRQQ